MSIEGLGPKTEIEEKLCRFTRIQEHSRALQGFGMFRHKISLKVLELHI
jgi:hypothetical protein